MKPTARTLRCPSCGAPATSEATRCAYCQSRLATVGCPACFALMFEGSSHCPSCGAARQRVETGDRHHARCPACAGEMTWVTVGTTDLLECGGCDGTWVEAETFERICADRESQSAVLHAPRRVSAAHDMKSAPVRYRPCPRCSTLMNRVNFGKSSGAIVDVCKGHGTFLDRGELHQIVRYIQDGGLDRARAAEKERLAEEIRRLRDTERMHARMFPASRSPEPEGFPIGDLLSALFGR